jgi:chromosomal replication initiator protein
MVAYSSVMRVPITVELAHDVLSEFFLDKPIPGRARKDVPIGAIVEAVCEACGIDKVTLLGPRRDRPTATARQIGMYLCRELTGLSYAQIGAEFGGRDHTTVQRAIAKIEEALMHDPALRTRVNELRGRLGR